MDFDLSHTDFVLAAHVQAELPMALKQLNDEERLALISTLTTSAVTHYKPRMLGEILCIADKHLTETPIAGIGDSADLLEYLFTVKAIPPLNELFWTCVNDQVETAQLTESSPFAFEGLLTEINRKLTPSSVDDIETKRVLTGYQQYLEFIDKGPWKHEGVLVNPGFDQTGPTLQDVSQRNINSILITYLRHTKATSCSHYDERTLDSLIDSLAQGHCSGYAYTFAISQLHGAQQAYGELMQAIAQLNQHPHFKDYGRLANPRLFPLQWYTDVGETSALVETLLSSPVSLSTATREYLGLEPDTDLSYKALLDRFISSTYLSQSANFDFLDNPEGDFPQEKWGTFSTILDDVELSSQSLFLPHLKGALLGAIEPLDSISPTPENPIVISIHSFSHVVCLVLNPDGTKYFYDSNNAAGAVSVSSFQLALDFFQQDYLSKKSESSQPCLMVRVYSDEHSLVDKLSKSIQSSILRVSQQATPEDFDAIVYKFFNESSINRKEYLFNLIREKPDNHHFNDTLLLSAVAKLHSKNHDASGYTGMAHWEKESLMEKWCNCLTEADIIRVIRKVFEGELSLPAALESEKSFFIIQLLKLWKRTTHADLIEKVTKECPESLIFVAVDTDNLKFFDFLTRECLNPTDILFKNIVTALNEQKGHHLDAKQTELNQNKLDTLTSIKASQQKQTAFVPTAAHTVVQVRESAAHSTRLTDADSGADARPRHVKKV